MTTPNPEKDARETRRLFFALETDEEVRSNILDVSQRLQKAARFTSARILWVPPENFHVTLYFLGETRLQIADQLAALLADAVRDVAPFTLDVRHLGLFPKDPKTPPRVLWAGIHNPSPAIHLLRDQVASIIARAGLAVPDQDFSPHITIARFKSTSGLRPFRDMLREYEHVKAGKCEVTRLVLMESITGGGPARYQPFALAPFPPPVA